MLLYLFPFFNKKSAIPVDFPASCAHVNTVVTSCASPGNMLLGSSWSMEESYPMLYPMVFTPEYIAEAVAALSGTW